MANNRRISHIKKSFPDTVSTVLHPSRNIIRRYIYLSFTLIGLSCIWRGSEPVIYVAFIPLLIYIKHMNLLSRKQVLVDFYAASFILCGLAYLFLFQMAPQNWSITLDSKLSLVFGFISWTLVCLCSSLASLVLSVPLILLRSTYRLAAVPFLWVISEIARSYLFATMSYGPGSSFSPNFNWGAVAVSASATPLVYASRFVGFFGLTLGVVLVNVAILGFMYRRARRVSVLLIGAVLVLTFAGWNSVAAPTHTISTVFMHLDEHDSVEFWEEWHQLPEDIDLLVLPEYSEVFKNKDYKRIAQKLSPDGIGVTSVAHGQSPNATNRLTYFNQNGDIVAVQDKTFLIPTGETVPYSIAAAFKLINQSVILMEFNQRQQLVPGNQAEYPVRAKDFSVGALPCSGIIALNQYRQLADQGADVLVNSASLSFMKYDSLYHVHARNMARFHAVSNRRPLIQASRSGESYIIDPQGTIHQPVKDAQLYPQQFQLGIN